MLLTIYQKHWRHYTEINKNLKPESNVSYMSKPADLKACHQRVFRPPPNFLFTYCTSCCFDRPKPVLQMLFPLPLNILMFYSFSDKTELTNQPCSGRRNRYSRATERKTLLLVHRLDSIVHYTVWNSLKFQPYNQSIANPVAFHTRDILSTFQCTIAYYLKNVVAAESVG